MPALNETDYAKFAQMLDELSPEVDRMKETPRNFMRDMLEKNKQYGERVFVSVKQLDWIKKLHEEYIGDTAHESDDDNDPANRDMSDDIPF